MLSVIHQGLALVLASDMLRNDPVIPEEDEPIRSLNFQKLNTCIHEENKVIIAPRGGSWCQEFPAQDLGSIDTVSVTLSVD